MKFKLLKSTILLSLATPIVAIASSCNTAKVETTNTTNENKTVKTNTQLNAITKYTVTFKAQAGQEGVTFTGPTMVTARANSKFYSIEQPTAYKDQRPQTYWVNAATGDKITDSTVITGNMEVYPYFQADIKLENCLSIIALEYTKLNITHYGTNGLEPGVEGSTRPKLQYSSDGFTWTEWSTGTINILPGEAIYIRGNNKDGFNHSEYNYSAFSLAGTVHINGTAMSLLDDGTGSIKQTVPNDYCFARLFENCSGIKVISSNFLPATTLKAHCYDSMFKGCTALESFPSDLLPAGKEVSGETIGTLAEACYKDMFTNCSKLGTVSTSLLPAKTLKKDCYNQMFRGCTGLTALESTILPATDNLAEKCYAGMFRGCTNISALPNDLLKSTKLQPSCYYGMFADCKGIGDLSSFSLPATTMVNYCYREMFYNCTSLTLAPALNATTLANWCYYGMFYNCYALTACPTLYTDANLQMCDSCYAYMFYNCKTITAAPTLSSTLLANSCYKAMFYNCLALNPSTYTLPATKLYDHCYDEMFYHCIALVNAPTISATSLAPYCCQQMFFNCTGLTSSPALAATAAAEGCYKNMFGSCTALTSIGMISLSSLANYACFMMFMDCSAVTISTTSGTNFFTCPSTSSFEESVTSMFQGTKGASGGYAPTSGYTYRYS